MSNCIYLYIKEHQQTGLKYFGKTVQDPFKYQGSGTYWKNHLKVHGDYVSTQVIFSSNDKEECKKFAIKFSLENDIVNSEEWANLKIEELDGGGDCSHLHTPEIYAKASLKKIGQKRNKESKEKMSASRIKYIESLSDEERKEILGKGARESLKNGTHTWAGERGSQFAKERNARWTLEGTNPLSGDGTIQRNINRRRVDNGTHNFQDEEWRQKELNRRKEQKIGLFGMNPNNTFVSCLYCRKETGLPTFKRWHGENCSQYYKSLYK